MEKNLKIRNRPKCIKKAMANNKGGGMPQISWGKRGLFNEMWWLHTFGNQSIDQ